MKKLFEKKMTFKPRSMPTGQRNVLRPNDSTSLWNYTLSPGWTQEESELLRRAVIYFGIGNWASIIQSGCLPLKTNAQMNLQLQRMLGQQSTVEFKGLHIDPIVIGEKNSRIQGPEVKRKNNCIVNTGSMVICDWMMWVDKLSREEIKSRIQENKETYELPESEWKAIQVDRKQDDVALLANKKAELQQLLEELENVSTQIKAIQANHVLFHNWTKRRRKTPQPSPKSPLQTNTTTNVYEWTDMHSTRSMYHKRILMVATSIITLPQEKCCCCASLKARSARISSTIVSL
jgi:hypothetical protein